MQSRTFRGQTQICLPDHCSDNPSSVLVLLAFIWSFVNELRKCVCGNEYVNVLIGIVYYLSSELRWIRKSDWLPQIYSKQQQYTIQQNDSVFPRCTLTEWGQSANNTDCVVPEKSIHDLVRAHWPTDKLASSFLAKNSTSDVMRIDSTTRYNVWLPHGISYRNLVANLCYPMLGIHPTTQTQVPSFVVI